MSPWTAEDLRQYREQGYLIYRAPLFSPHELAELRATF